MTVPCKKPARVPCKIALVGEAPSDIEVLRGQVFVGPSGRVLDQALRVAGIERDDLFLTNVFNEKVPQNKIGNWCAKTAEARGWHDYRLGPIGDTGYLRPEFVPHLARLGSELRECEPTLVVTLGDVALWALTGYPGLANRRGATTRATELYPGVKLLPTFHPAYVIKDWKMFHVLVGDLIKAKRECEFPEVRHTECELWLEPTLEDMEIFSAGPLAKADIISIDIETAGGQITCVGFGADAHTAITVPFSDWRKANRSYWETAEQELAAWEWVRSVCGNGKMKLLQNGLYDCYWLWNERGIGVRNFRHDTRLLHHALYPELPKSLAFMGSTYAERGPWKTMRHRVAEKRDE